MAFQEYSRPIPMNNTLPSISGMTGEVRPKIRLPSFREHFGYLDNPQMSTAAPTFFQHPAPQIEASATSRCRYNPSYKPFIVRDMQKYVPYIGTLGPEKLPQYDVSPKDLEPGHKDKKAAEDAEARKELSSEGAVVSGTPPTATLVKVSTKSAAKSGNGSAQGKKRSRKEANVDEVPPDDKPRKKRAVNTPVKKVTRKATRSLPPEAKLTSAKVPEKTAQPTELENKAGNSVAPEGTKLTIKIPARPPMGENDQLPNTCPPTASVETASISMDTAVASTGVNEHEAADGASLKQGPVGNLRRSERKRKSINLASTI